MNHPNRSRRRPEDLDHDRVTGIAKPMLIAIRDNYLAGPNHRDRLFEALNALAYCAATIIAGTQDRDGRRITREFLDKAVTQNVDDLMRNPPAREN